MKWVYLFAALGAATTAQAQDLRYSSDQSVVCAAQAGSQLDKRACVGLSANLCMGATPDGSTTYGMGTCLGKELEYWDARLNSAYKVIRAKATAWDADAGDSGSPVRPMAVSLLEMQRAWIAYRDATCVFERSQWGSGTGGGPVQIACLLRLTGEQALFLEDAWFGE